MARPISVISADIVSAQAAFTLICTGQSASLQGRSWSLPDLGKVREIIMALNFELQIAQGEAVGQDYHFGTTNIQGLGRNNPFGGGLYP